MSPELLSIQTILQQRSSAEVAAAQRKFVPGRQQLYGVKTPELNKLASQFKKAGFQLVEELWNAGAFEEKLLAIKILEKIAKQDPGRALDLIPRFASSIGNWAECDAIGMQALKSIVTSHPLEIFKLAQKFNRSPNHWERRLSLVLVEWYTRDVAFHSPIKELLDALEDDKEYYVRKAAEWLKRNSKKGK